MRARASPSLRVIVSGARFAPLPMHPDASAQTSSVGGAETTTAAAGATGVTATGAGGVTTGGASSPHAESVRASTSGVTMEDGRIAGSLPRGLVMARRLLGKAIEGDVDDRRREERQACDGDQTADDRNAKWRTQFAAHTGSE